MSLCLARTMTKTEVAAAAGVSEELVRQYAKDGTIPASFFVLDGKTYRFVPATVVVIELAVELAELFGQISAIPKAVARQIVPALESAWNGTASSAVLEVTKGSIEVRASLSCIERARQKVAALA
jgi:hypothetical protein